MASNDQPVNSIATADILGPVNPAAAPVAAPAPIAPVQAPTDQAIPPVVVDPISTQELLPSTPTRQLETESAIAAEPKLKKIDPDRVKNLMKQGFSKAGAELRIIQETKRKMNIAKEREDKAQTAKTEQMKEGMQDLDTEKAEIEQALIDANEVGFDSTSLKARLDQIEEEKDQLQSQAGFTAFPSEQLEGGAEEPSSQLEVDSAAQPDAVADRADIKDANAMANEISQDEVLNKANEIKAANTQKQAEQLALQDEIDAQKQVVNEALTKIQAEDVELEKIDPNRFWESKATWNKVLTFIGMALGGASAVQTVQQAINRDIESQKLNAQQTLAKKERAYKMVNLEIDRLSKLTNNQVQLERLQVAKDQVNVKQLELRMKRQTELIKSAQKQSLGLKLASEEGMNREDFFSLDKELKKTGIAFKDGKFRFASGPEAAKKVRETMNEMNSALTGLQGLKDIGKQFLGGSLDIFEARAQAKLLQQSIVGKLRLDLFGPGVLTDTEQKIAREIIGNPAQFFKVSKIEMTKLDALMNKLRHSTRQAIRISGIKLPASDNDRNIAALIKEQARIKGFSIEKVLKNKSTYKKLKNDAIKTLNRNNEWVEETEF